MLGPFGDGRATAAVSVFRSVVDVTMHGTCVDVFSSSLRITELVVSSMLT